MRALQDLGPTSAAQREFGSPRFAGLEHKSTAHTADDELIEVTDFGRVHGIGRHPALQMTALLSD
jgi:hypothetical protein